MSPKGDSNILVIFWLVISKPDFALTLARPGHTRPNSTRPFGMTGYFACIGIVNRKWPKTFINMYTIDEPTDWLYLHSQCYQIASVTSALEWLDLNSWKCLLMKSMKSMQSVHFSVTCKTSKKNFNDFYLKKLAPSLVWLLLVVPLLYNYYTKYIGTGTSTCNIAITNYLQTLWRRKYCSLQK